jgi:hypothetical protein
MGKCREGHENHICQIKEFDKIKKLVKDAEYCCKNCGRSAKDKDNLCNPTKL